MAAPPPPEGWAAHLLDQFRFHWDVHLRPRLAGLTDEEYFWEPAPAMWSIRPREEAQAELLGGADSHVMEWACPEPDRPRSPPLPGAWLT